MKRQKLLFLFSIFALMLLSSCADNASYTVDCANCHVYGFWGGLWHGLIACFDFIGMLIWDDVAVYAPNNNGPWYACGFVIGIGGFSFSVTKST